MNNFLTSQMKCGGPDGYNMSCVVDSNNFVICTCNRFKGLKPLETIGDSTKFKFYVNGSPCT